MAHPTSDRPNNRETEYEDIKVPDREGEPPRTSTEPHGSEGSSDSDKTRTDPASGEQDGEDIGPQELRDTPKVG